jgi:hypothetical protein
VEKLIVLTSKLQYFRNISFEELYLIYCIAVYSLRLAGYFGGLFLDPEDGGNIFLRTMGKVTTDFKAINTSKLILLFSGASIKHSPRTADSGQALLMSKHPRNK